MPLETTTPKPTPVPAPRCINPIPVSPLLTSTGRSRRPSTRRSFSSAVRSSSRSSEIVRTLCAKDHDSFSYDSAYLKEWYMPSDMWVKLPVALRDCISVVQHAGAAVLTGFERLQDLQANLLAEGDDDNSNNSLDDDLTTSALKLSTLDLSASTDSLLSDHDDVDSPAPLVGARKFSAHVIPSLDRARSDSVFSNSQASQAPSLSFGSSPSPPVSGSSTPMTPMSPLSKPVLATAFVLPSPVGSKPASGAQSPILTGVRTFNLPLKPLTAYYRAEIQALKSETLVRLRHAARKVDVELNILDERYGDVVRWWIGIRTKIDYISACI